MTRHYNVMLTLLSTRLITMQVNILRHVPYQSTIVIYSSARETHYPVHMWKLYSSFYIDTLISNDSSRATHNSGLL